MGQGFSFFELQKETDANIYEALDSIKKKWGIPCYIFDVQKARKNVRELRRNMGASVKIAYAMKANPWIAKPIMDVSDYIEVCSEGELELCMNYGIPGNRIVLDGVLKTEGLIKQALGMRIARWSIDSREQLERVLSMKKDYEKLNLLLRVSSGNRFGMDKRELQECVALCKEVCNAEIVGIQYYPGTQRSDFKKVKRELNMLWEWVEICERMPGLCLREIEFGAGIGVPYFEGDDMEDYKRALQEVVNFVRVFSGKYEITYESGRNIAASCGAYVTEVFERKARNEKNVLFCLGGTNHLQYHGRVLGIRTPAVKGICRDVSEEMENYMISGALCSDDDIFARECRMDKNMTAGDFVVFYGAGAYCATGSPNLFLAMEMPAILLYNEQDKTAGSICRLRGCLPTYRLMSNRVDKI